MYVELGYHGLVDHAFRAIFYKVIIGRDSQTNLPRRPNVRAGLGLGMGTKKHEHSPDRKRPGTK